MKRMVITGACVLGITALQAQVPMEVLNENSYDHSKDTTRKEGWTGGGTFTLLLNQSAFSNWLPGGENNIAGNVGINYDLNYTKGGWTWDNKFLVSYGLTKIKNYSMRKTDDRLELYSLAGKKASGCWSYSFFASFRTQFSKGYNYEVDQVGSYAISGGFFKPAYLAFGPGMLWKKNDNLKVNLAPLTSRMTFLNGEIFTYNKDTEIFESSNEVTTYGVLPGEKFLYQLGFYASGYYKLNAMKNVSVENILNLYANYLDNPQNIYVDYSLNVVMQVNDYLSTNLVFQAIYDHNAYKGFQIREVFGLGINYRL